MDRNDAVWHGLAVTLVIIVSFSVTIAGVTTVSADAHGDQTYNISDPGDPEDLFSFENTQNISNIEITADKEETNIRNLTLYLGFSELENTGFNMSRVNIRRSEVFGGNITSSKIIDHRQNSVLAIQIKASNTTNPVQIKSIQLDGVNSSTAENAGSIEYELGVVNQDTTRTYADLKEENLTKRSGSFRHLTGSIEISEQATVSTNYQRGSRTDSGVTITKIRSNVNSTVVITDRGSGEVVGYQFKNAKEMNGSRMISLNTSNLGGKYNAYLIPSEEADQGEYEIDSELPDRLKDSAVDRDKFHVYLGTVQFEDQIYDSGEATEVTVARTEVRDTIGMKTPYIVSIHPMTADGRIHYEKYVGYSNVLTGVHDELSVPIKNSNGKSSKISRSNRYIATIRLAGGQVPGDSADISSTRPLLNSDISDHFVDGDVSDSAEIRISNVASYSSSTDMFHYEYDRSEYDGEILYSGEVVGFEHNSTSNKSVELQRERPDSRSVVVGIGSSVEGTEKVVFNTTGLRTGIYSLSKDSGSKQFRIVGEDDQTTGFQTTDNSTKIGGHPEYQLHHNVSGVKATVTNSNASQIYATADIATPDPGRTSISVNTYALGNESLTGSAITAGSGATVESVETSLPNATLSPGTYRVAVRSEQGLAATSDEASVTVESRATNGMRVYSTADLDRDELGTARAVRRAIDEGTLSRTETVRAGETVVYAVNATGLTGLPAARNATVETGRDLARLDGLAFGVRSNASAVATATGDVESVPTNSTVHLDERGLFVVGRGSDVLATDETPTDGETFTAEFRVEDERLRAATSDSADDHDVSATVTFEGAESPEDDGDPSDGGDSTGGGGATGGSGGSGAGGGGGPGAGGGGGPSAGGPGQAVGSESAAASTEDAPTTGPAAEEARGRGEDPARLGFRRAGSRAEIRPAADVRGVASDESAVPPTGASVWTGPARARNDRSGSDADPSGDGSPSGATGTAASGNEEGSAAGAGEEGSAATNGGASAGDATGAPSTGGDATDAEPPTPSYDDAPIRATAEDVPGFGPPVTVVALLLAGGLGARRRGS